MNDAYLFVVLCLSKFPFRVAFALRQDVLKKESPKTYQKEITILSIGLCK